MGLLFRTHERSHSVWGYIKYNLWEYINPYYNENEIIPVIDDPLKISELSYE